VRLDALLLMVPNRSDAQVGFLNAEGGFRFGELDIGLPKFLVGPLADVAAQDIGALAQSGPLIPLRLRAPFQSHS